jgi:hypothetical protein
MRLGWLARAAFVFRLTFASPFVLLRSSGWILQSRQPNHPRNFFELELGFPMDALRIHKAHPVSVSVALFES